MSFSERKTKKKVQEYIKQINWYSNNKINRACGNRAEDLFEIAMGRSGSNFGGKNTRKWKKREWKNSLENLDFIFTKDGKDYGFEIKNRFPYIKKNTIQAKIKICDYLKLIPIFVVREMPYSHQQIINDAGGFVIRFSAKLFPDYFRQNITELYSITHLPVSHAKIFPEKSIRLFISNFHDRN